MEEFEFEGLWWLPGTPEDRAPGTLEFSPDSGATLELLDSIKDPENRFAAMQRNLMEAELILGLSSKGKPVTLWNCRETNKDVNMAGFIKTSFRAGIVLVGAHLAAVGNVRFKKVMAEYRHLDEWAGISGFSLKLPDDHTTHPMVIEHKRPSPVVASVAGARFGIEVRATLREKSFGLVGEAAIAQKTLFSVEYPQGKPFEEWSRILHRLRNFLTLGVGELVEPLALQGTVESEEMQVVEIYYRLAGVRGADRKVHPAEMLFTLDDFREDFGRVLGNWFEKAKTLEPVYDQYFSTAYGSAAYLDDRFLSLVQGVEAYHRRAIRTTELPEGEHEQRLGEILDAAPEAHREWLRGKLAYSNEPSLRRRLKEIMRRDPDVMEPIFGNSKKERIGFVGKVVETRNYLIHFDENKKQAAAVGEELYQLTKKLSSVLEACLLRETGFGEEQVQEILSRKRKFG